ncbi:protein kinase domain-containing protein [Actinomadura atramentaria]|uniref:serine/threonine-protein kinase n=1 Tax=Actinomadura atramentaria TaxID=1990 RepID=UPI0012FA1BA9|nr:protein kinase [Actinomadura atramentaria]
MGRDRLLNGRYRLLDRLGTGGMGSVWSAEDTVLGRTVALKELTHHLSGPDLAERRARALREARALAQAEDPAIVQIYDVFVERDDPWLVMRYLSGPSLADLVAQEPQDEYSVARIGLRVLRALTAAHGAGVLHRDVKPANILLDGAGLAYLVDFGIAHISGATALTAANTVLGTLEYMAPERIRGEAVGPPSDLWSLGVTLFYALEGRSPFRPGGEDAAATIWAIMSGPVPRPARPGPLADAVAGLLERDPDARLRAPELDAALRAALTARPRTLPDHGRPDRRGPGYRPPDPYAPDPYAPDPYAQDAYAPDRRAPDRASDRPADRRAPADRTPDRRAPDRASDRASGHPSDRASDRPADRAPGPASDRPSARDRRSSDDRAAGRAPRRGLSARDPGGRDEPTRAAPAPRVPGPSPDAGRIARAVRGLPPADAAAELRRRPPAVVRDVLAGLGPAAGPVLLALPGETAAQVLAVSGPRTAAVLLDAMAPWPDRAAHVVRMLSTTHTARAFGYLSEAGAGALAAAMPPRDAARVLGGTDLRAAAAVLGALPVPAAARIVDAMAVRQACAVLGYVPSDTVAAIVRASAGGRGDRLLAGLSGPVRTQVLRHL